MIWSGSFQKIIQFWNFSKTWEKTNSPNIFYLNMYLLNIRHTDIQSYLLWDLTGYNNLFGLIKKAHWEHFGQYTFVQDKTHQFITNASINYRKDNLLDSQDFVSQAYTLECLECSLTRIIYYIRATHKTIVQDRFSNKTQSIQQRWMESDLNGTMWLVLKHFFLSAKIRDE